MMLQFSILALERVKSEFCAFVNAYTENNT